MRVVTVVGILGWASAHADPPSAFETCKARRRELTAEALRVTDVVERGRQLAAMPVCRRLPDGETEVVEPPPPPAPDVSPFAPHASWAVRAGVEALTADGHGELGPTGSGPHVDVEVAYRFERAWSIAAFGRYRYIVDDFVPVSNPTPVDVMITSIHDQFIGGGARLDRHAGAVWFGGGLGGDYEHMRGYTGVVTHALRTVEVHVGYAFWHTPYVDVHAMVELGESGKLVDASREMLAASLTIGVSR
jgi:hypothetical protein